MTNFGSAGVGHETWSGSKRGAAPALRAKGQDHLVEYVLVVTVVVMVVLAILGV